MARSRALIVLLVVTAALAACSGGGHKQANKTSTTSRAGTAAGVRTPSFGTAGRIAPTVKALPSVDPTLVVQFPLFPSGVKDRFPDASGLVTVVQGNPEIGTADTVTIEVQKMPPDVKFTVFLTELAGKPFGHAQYLGDLITRGDGSGESVLHAIVFAAFAADNRNPSASGDQSGDASGIQLEHLGLWFDNLGVSRASLQDPSVGGTPFDGGPPPLHAGPQAMTDGQDLAVV